MAHIVPSFKAMQDFLKAFSIPDTNVTEITIKFRVNDVVRIDITRLSTNDMNFEEISEKYYLAKQPNIQEDGTKS